MMFAGIDAGTSSFEIFLLEDDEPVESIEIPTKEIKDDPNVFNEILRDLKPDLAAGLSGYGLPAKKFSELSEREVFLMTLNLDEESTVGIRQVIKLARELELSIYTIPGVIHLPTIPDYRKLNRIDMGTSDKLCSAILGIYQLSEKSENTFVLLESGFGFNAFIAVKDGRIVDGLGGSSSFPAFSAMGAMDGELAYLLKTFPKSLLFSGGMRSFLKDRGKKVKSIEDLEYDALHWFSEFLMKGVRAVDVSCKAGKILLSGKNFSFDKLTELFVERAGEFGYECEVLRGFGIGKQSAEGAAIIANGIGGGTFRKIVEQAEILKARGSVLDYLTSDVRDYLRIQLSQL
jgi:predicted butyrate kinase (DUF1464 family)